METLLRDVRYGVRMLLREPGFSLLAILALALGTGATTAIFTVVDSVLLRPLAYKDPGRLVVALHGPTANNPVSPADYFDYRRDARSFERLSAAQAWDVTLGGGDRLERVAGLQVSADLFDLLAVPPMLGRRFVEGEDRPGRDQVVVLSYALWRRRFGGDRAVVGQPASIDGRPYVVVGVMPPTFRFAPFWATRAEVWAPLTLASRTGDRSGRSLRLFGRLKAGVTVAQAQAEMSAIAGRLRQTYPVTNAGVEITVRPLLEKVVSGIRPTLVALMGMVTFVLLIACANVANTLLARAASRQKEIALRTAIGASRARVIRQLLTESVVLASIGAAAGLAVAVLGVNWLLSMLPPGSLPRQQDVGLDARVFVVASLAALISGLTTGLAPAVQLLRTSVTTALQDGGKGVTEGTGRKRVRSLLVTGEVALALILLAGAGLMGRKLLELRAIDPGFRLDHVAVANISLAAPRADPAVRQVIFEDVRGHLATIPGVSAVSAINHLPLAGDVWNLGYTIEGRPAPPPGQGWSAVYRIVRPGYFATMGLPLIEGRDISGADIASTPPVAIVNHAMAQRRWPGESPVGRRIRLPGVSNVREPITIVGVSADAKQGDWTSPPEDEVYLAFAQRAGEFGLSTMTFVLRTTLDAGRVAAAIPQEIALADRTLAVSGNTTLEQVVAEELWRERLMAGLTGIFATVALGLAAIGVYAVVAYSVGRRTREFGVRVALGATRGDVQWLALADAMGPVLLGAGLGLAVALAGARLIRTLLYEVNPIDPLTLGGATLLLLIVATSAAWMPARRASGRDPSAALRQE